MPAKTLTFPPTPSPPPALREQRILLQFLLFNIHIILHINELTFLLKIMRAFNLKKKSLQKILHKFKF